MWSIHNRLDIIAKYEVLERVGFNAYSDVYRARRLSDNLVVALNEVHDYQSAFCKIEDLEILQNSLNVVILHEYLWWEDGNKDVVLVLEYLRIDLARVVREAKRDDCGIGIGDLKRWMVQILYGVDACHKNGIVFRDLKPDNLLVSNDGVLKIACSNCSSGLAWSSHEAEFLETKYVIIVSAFLLRFIFFKWLTWHTNCTPSI
ncbi:cyclin-dependent kinase F-1-like [Juglans microcarpa x Juglans regia]|uniref:cyclin-dependent kinase F-1-like n=1 Tax=Juglans microcarpa x Juglans regia TaxID=2249226 RepID=UPI001B7E4B3F|nr:cyclin-dependent kinase F-1-like [Juglans microcarpa x Juglans regia]